MDMLCPYTAYSSVTLCTQTRLTQATGGTIRETLRCLVPKKQDDSWGFVTVSKIEPTPRQQLLDKLDLGLLQLDRSGIALTWQITSLRPAGLEPWFSFS